VLELVLLEQNLKTKVNMDLNTFKIYGLYFFGLFVNFTNVDLLLKAFLTIVITGFTIYKWYIMYQDRNKMKKDEPHKKL
tara:strand:+ start:5 stop:241 length:237 start_codon:yes stop_codon:yes gene_type:complete